MHQNLALGLLLGVSICQAASSDQTKPPWRVGAGNVRIETGDVTRLIGPGWVRTSRASLDHEVQLEFRAVSPQTEGSVLIRVVAQRPGENPSLGYRISLTGEPDGKKAFGRVQALSTKLTKEEFQAGERVGGDWQQLTVRAVGDEIVSMLNGRVVARVEGREHQVGYVGIEVKRGALEFRKLRITPIGTPGCSDGIGGRSTAAKLQDSGVKLPNVVREVRPHYTVEAMSDKTRGTVWVQAVVMPDGNVGEACVTKSLHPDLDLEALAAARQWAFKPGTRDGQPVPVLVTIELTFTLK